MWTLYDTGIRYFADEYTCKGTITDKTIEMFCCDFNLKNIFLQINSVTF